MKNFTFVSLLLVFMFLLSGCNNASGTQHSSHGQAVAEGTGGDQLETTSGPDKLPSFLANVDPSIQNIYKLAAKNDQVIASMACYCGCGNSVGHKSNKECFIKEKKADGRIIWNSHAITCDNCQNIAAESIQLKNTTGKSLLEIRKIIDNKYKKGYAEPTPTPLPAS